MKKHVIKKHIIFQILIVAIIITLIVIMVVDLLPLIENVASNSGNESNMVNYIDSYGTKGVPILIGMQALQVIVAVIPSAAIQVLTGLCYGAYWGTLINLSGCLLGNILIFTAVRQLKDLIAPLLKHRNHIHKKFISKEMLDKIKKPEYVAFFFFLIPGIPNGIVPYVFAETKVSTWRYMVAVIAGSIPSTFICTFLGERVSTGNYTTAIVIGAVILLIMTIVIIYRKKIMSKITQSDKHDKPHPHEI